MAATGLDVAETVEFRSALTALVEDPRPPHQSLKSILEIIDSVHHLDAGVIYVADPVKQEFVCLAQNGCDALAGPGGVPRFRFDSQSLVGKVYREKKGYYSATPGTDTQNVSQEGIHSFQIRTSVVGVPMMVQDRVLGVIVMWSNGSSGPGQHHVELLQPFAHLAAGHLALFASEQERTAAFRRLPAILEQVLGEANQKAALKVIMEALPFDRVRVYEYDPASRCFIPLDSRGMPDADRFMQVRIYVDKNPWAAHTVEMLSKEPRAEVYPKAEIYPGPDPDAGLLNKPEHLPWAVVPLVVNKELIGQIVVDNAEFEDPITDDAKNYLTAISALALAPIASRRSMQFLSLNSLPVLYSSLASDIDRANVIKRLLIYLTCGTSMGFSRAVFLEWRDRPERLAYRASIGSLTRKRFEEIGKGIRGQSLEEILANASNTFDYDIDAKLKDFQMDLSKESVLGSLKDVRRMELSARPGGSDWPDDLARRVGEGCILTAPLRGDKHSLGLFIVDRRWQERQIDEVDEYALRTFAHLASQVLEQNSYQLQSARERTDEAWQMMASAAAHEFRDPVNAIDILLRSTNRAIQRGDREAAREGLSNIERTVGQIKTFLHDFVSLGGQIDARPVRLEQILNSAGHALELKSKGIEFHVNCSPHIKVFGDRKRLAACFRELFSNSLYSFDKDRKRIRIEVNTPSVEMTPSPLDTTVRYAMIHVTDNGIGIATDDDRIYELGYTKRPDGIESGHGFGLFMVKRTIEAHRGRITHYGRIGRGVTFAVVLPLPSDCDTEGIQRLGRVHFVEEEPYGT